MRTETYLGHLEGNNLGVSTLSARDVPCVSADDLGTLGVTAVVLDTFVTESSLILRKCDTGDTAAVVLVREGSKSAPSTSDIEKMVFRLKVELKAR